MSVLAANSKRNARGLAAVFMVIGGLGMPLALAINAGVAIGFFASLGDMIFATGHARDVIGLGTMMVGYSLGIFGWALTIDYLSKRRMSVASGLLMWSIHSAINIAIGVTIIAIVVDGNAATNWPGLLMGSGYGLLGLLAMRAGIRDYIGSVIR